MSKEFKNCDCNGNEILNGMKVKFNNDGGIGTVFDDDWDEGEVKVAFEDEEEDNDYNIVSDLLTIIPEEKVFDGEFVIMELLCDLASKGIYDVPLNLVYAIIARINDSLKSYKEEVKIQMSEWILEGFCEGANEEFFNITDASWKDKHYLTEIGFTAEGVVVFNQNPDIFKIKACSTFCGGMPLYVVLAIQRTIRGEDLQLNPNTRMIEGNTLKYLYSLKMWGAAFKTDNAFLTVSNLEENTYIFDSRESRDSMAELIKFSLDDGYMSSEYEGYLLDYDVVSTVEIYDNETNKNFIIKENFGQGYYTSGAEYMMTQGNYSCTCALSQYIREQCDHDFPKLECSDERLDNNNVTVAYVKSENKANRVYDIKFNRYDKSAIRLPDYVPDMLSNHMNYNKVFTLDSNELMCIDLSKEIRIDSLAYIENEVGIMAKSFEIRIPALSQRKPKPVHNWENNGKFYSNVKGGKK